MQSIEKLFALVDRKLDAFDFAIKKVKGKQTGNEFYALSVGCIINGKDFTKKVLTVGCPKGAIEYIVKSILDELKAVSVKKVTLRKIETLSGQAPCCSQTQCYDEDTSVSPLRIRVEEEVDESDYEHYDDEGEECEDCDDDCCQCCDTAAHKVVLKLTPTSQAPQPATQASPVTQGPKDCPYCAAKVAPNFAYCPMCGGKQ